MNDAKSNDKMASTSVRISHQDDDVNIYESGLDDEKESCRLVNIQVAIDL